MKNPNKTVDQLYEELVRDSGLYGKAFFRQKMTRQEKKKLKSLHKQATMAIAEKKKLQKAIAKKIARPTIGAIPQVDLNNLPVVDNIFENGEPEV